MWSLARPTLDGATRPSGLARRWVLAVPSHLCGSLQCALRSSRVTAIFCLIRQYF